MACFRIPFQRKDFKVLLNTRGTIFNIYIIITVYHHRAESSFIRARKKPNRQQTDPNFAKIISVELDISLLICTFVLSINGEREKKPFENLCVDGGF